MRVDDLSPAPVLRQARGTDPIAQALRDVEFPISKQELIVRLGDRALGHGDMLAPLSDIVRGIAQARFGDAAQAQRAVSARWLRFAKALDAVEEAEEKRGREERPATGA